MPADDDDNLRKRADLIETEAAVPISRFESIGTRDELSTVSIPDTSSEERIYDSPNQSSSLFQHIREKIDVSEFSGACGDFGTLIPLLVAMARGRCIYLAPTLFLSGIVHIVTGCYWDIPMPLQPMKAIAALAIAQELTREQVTTAGIGMGAVFLLLSIKNFIDVVNRWIPMSVIGGLQLGVGWKLALKGIHMIENLPWWFSSSSLDCITLSIFCGLLCIYGLRKRLVAESDQPQNDARRSANQADEVVEGETAMLATDTSEDDDNIPDTGIASAQEKSCCWLLVESPPVGIILFIVGIIMAAIQLAIKGENDSTGLKAQQASSEHDVVITSEPLLVNALRNASMSDWRIGFLLGTLTQLPLTTLNSCLSVCMLAYTLFPSHKVRRVSRRSVCISIGIINFGLCPLGMMPSCHGAGGLAGQHRLGAKSGVSMLILGLFKIFMGLLASYGFLLRFLDAIPVSVLGVLLALAGHELASTGIIKVAKSSILQNTEENIAVCLITALVIVGTGHAHVGALSGWITCIIYRGGKFHNQRHESEDSERHSARGRYTSIAQGIDAD